MSFAVAATGVHEANQTPAKPQKLQAADATAALRLSADPAPVAARFVVSVTGRSTKAAGRTTQTERPAQDWYFFRDAQHVALLKGPIDEAWHRSASGGVSFERVFHEQQRAVDYSVGELAALGVQSHWAALSTFVDPQHLAALKVVARSGRGANERVRLAGKVAGGAVAVDWHTALQLPLLWVKTAADGTATRIVLAQHASVAPANWPVPGVRSADYLRLDAADFGDMAYEPVVKMSEALDVRLGWRTAHAHD